MTAAVIERPQVDLSELPSLDDVVKCKGCPHKATARIIWACDCPADVWCTCCFVKITDNLMQARAVDTIYHCSECGVEVETIMGRPLLEFVIADVQSL